MPSPRYDPAKPDVYVNFIGSHAMEALIKGAERALRVNDRPVRRLRNEIAERLQRVGAEDLGAQLKVLVKICSKYVNVHPSAPAGHSRYENAVLMFGGDWKFVYTYLGGKNGDPTPAFHRIEFLREARYPEEVTSLFWDELMRRLDTEETSDLTYHQLATKFHLGAASYVQNRRDLSEVRVLVSR